jgi:uncharacterized protein YxjI
MRYLMAQKLFSWGTDFYIKNERGENISFVDGKAFSIGNKLSFKGMNGNELLYIEQKLKFTPTYEIYRQGQLYARVEKELFTFFRHQFNIDVPGPHDLVAEGDFLSYEYTFYHYGKPVATVSKEWLTLANTYAVDVVDGEDALLILACTVVIDLVCHRSN